MRSRSAGEIMASGQLALAGPGDQPAPSSRCRPAPPGSAGSSRLDQDQRLVQLVERAEPAGEHHEPLGGPHEHHLARVEVVERERRCPGTGSRLLVRKLDVESGREAAALAGAAVRRLHQAGPPPVTTANPASANRRPVSRAARRTDRPTGDAGRAEDRDGRAAGSGDGLEAHAELVPDQGQARARRPARAGRGSPLLHGARVYSRRMDPARTAGPTVHSAAWNAASSGWRTSTA